MLDEFHLPKIKNFEALYYSTGNTQILNSREKMSRNVAKETAALMCKEGNVEISFVPRCGCPEDEPGALVGVFHEGQRCPKCGEICSTEFVHRNRFEVWFRVPEVMPPFIHPLVFQALHKWIGKPLMAALLDPKSVGDKLDTYFPVRGYRALYENFDEYMRILLDVYKPTAKKAETNGIREFIDRYRDAVFTRYLPILGSSLHVESSEGTKKYIDAQSKCVLELATNFSCLEYSSAFDAGYGKHWIDNKTVDIYYKYLDYVVGLIKQRMSGKKGMIKHHGGGTRLHLSARTVITPFCGPHKPDDIGIPWKIGLMLFKFELINLMGRDRSQTQDAILERWRAAFYKFDKGIHDHLNYLLKNNPYGRWPILFGRNPTIEYGSVMLMFISRVKTDPHDETINIPIEIVERLNADCDGDELYMICLKEMAYVEQFKRLHPKFMQLSQSKTEISTSVTPSKQTCIQGSARLDFDTLNSSCGDQILIRSK